ncbi:Os11g0470750 [Oryza sativa Japonica Group]|uniref:Os11g0470750 protein n=1 Tax=Oryza sativa subsp. japonica TaxID=39947 RepID=A0A0P0Y266_ORYSJ|nr:Os11g0470750 [Oryza sativa Japonica Group]
MIGPRSCGSTRVEAKQKWQDEATATGRECRGSATATTVVSLSAKCSTTTERKAHRRGSKNYSRELVDGEMEAELEDDDGCVGGDESWEVTQRCRWR